MASTGVEPIPIQAEQDIVAVRQSVRKRARELGFSLVEQTKLVTAASELARNALVHGRGGSCSVQKVTQPREGIRLTFQDHGPGIGDVDEALQDGVSTGAGLGLGLGGARRLVDDFDIHSKPGEGTRVTVTRWK
ncbi:MAG: anti-sigma regulatory factor [Phycisphaeraceae bacterium]